MKELFMVEAEKYHVLPMDDRVIERMNPAIAGRPDVMRGRTSLTLYPGMQGMLENTFINIKNSSFSITADVVIPANGAKGVILAQGGRFGGWCVYMKDDKPTFIYNFLGLEQYVIASDSKLNAGEVNLKFDFKYDGGGNGKGGDLTIFANGKSVATGRIERTQPNLFSADETADVGLDNQTPVAVTEDIGYGPVETAFTGEIRKVVVEIK
jgi:arylsulfatase